MYEKTPHVFAWRVQGPLLIGLEIPWKPFADCSEGQHENGSGQSNGGGLPRDPPGTQ